ncbi:MAG: glycosyltransferase family 2 protein [Patescibacteria group bacterium]
MEEKLPFVSVIIPCRNEEKFIAKCLNSLLEQDYPKENLEILIIDGASGDKTKEIAKEFAKKYPLIKVLDNPKKLTPIGLNIGLRASQGKIIARMDAHAEYENEYISKCVKYLNDYDVDNVGGQMVTLSRKDTAFGRAIVAALSHRFGVGSAIFRIGAKEPILVDTVFGGCYKREVFEKIGYFNENLPRGQDMDLNLRLRKFGGKILLVPEIKSFYYARSDILSFFDHSFTDGTELISPLKFGVKIFSWRHLAPLAFVLALGVLAFLAILSLKFLAVFLVFAGLYLLINLYFSVNIAFAEKDFRYLIFTPIVFLALHVGYGLGSVHGLLKTLTSRIFWINLKNKLSQALKK